MPGDIQHLTNIDATTLHACVIAYYSDLLIIRCRHQNIVELMGVCVDPPALVYGYMENGTLYKWLHSEVMCLFSSINLLVLLIGQWEKT